MTGLSAAPKATSFADEPNAEDSKPKIEPGAVEARFADDSVLKLLLKDEKVEIVTPYGKLLVPVADIQRIEFATRLSEADQKRIPVLIAKLGSQEFSERDAATAELLKLGAKAYPALLEAATSKDAEVVRRASDLVDKIREMVPAENLEVRPRDVIQTADSKIAGRITTTSLKATTSQFGEVTVKLVDMRNLLAGSARRGEGGSHCGPGAAVDGAIAKPGWPNFPLHGHGSRQRRRSLGDERVHARLLPGDGCRPLWHPQGRTNRSRKGENYSFAAGFRRFDTQRTD